MSRYSITLNFFISKEIVQELKKVVIEGNCSYDWRDSEFAHCTIKAISLCDKIPDEISVWSKEIERISSEQKPFQVIIKNVDSFPNIIFAKVYSQELVNLHKKLFSVLPSSQPEFENEKYIPHVSLVSISGSNNVKGVSNKKENFGTLEVRKVQLMIWNLENLNKSKVYKEYMLGK